MKIKLRWWWIPLGMVVLILAFLLLGSFQPKPDSTIYYFAGDNVVNILFADDSQVVSQNSNNLVSFNKYGNQQQINKGISASNSSQTSQKFFTTQITSSSFVGKIFNLEGKEENSLKNIVDTIWFENPLFIRVSQGSGFSREEVIDNKGTVILSGFFEQMAGFAQKYIAYNTGETGKDLELFLFDITTKKQVKTTKINSSSFNLRSYGDYLVFQDGNIVKVNNNALQESVLSGVTSLDSLSVNQSDNKVYTLKVSSANNITTIGLDLIDFSGSNKSSVNVFRLDQSSPFTTSKQIKSFWVLSESKLVVLSDGKLYILEKNR